MIQKGFFIRVTCDGENHEEWKPRELDIADFTKKGCNEILRVSGWKLIEGKWLCCNCQKLLKKEFSKVQK